MKIAICLSGISNICKESLDHFLSSIMHLDADVYIHSWINLGIADGLINIFPNVKKITLEHQDKKNKWNYIVKDLSVNPANTAFQLYGISESFKLALNSNIKYDFFVRCRFDVFVGNKIKYENLNSECMHMLPNGRSMPIESSKIFYEKINIHPLPKDFFWICNQKGAEVSANLFKDAEYYNIYEGIPMIGEDLMFHHFAKNDIQIELLENNQLNGLYRPLGHHHGNGLIIYDSFGPKKYSSS